MQQYETTHGSLPSPEELVGELGAAFEFIDGWGNRLVYVRDRGYLLIAPGSDGKVDHAPEEYRELADRMKADRKLEYIDSRGDFEVDMVIVDGEWLVFGGKP
ncbi:MAG: hypothetical protein HC882_01170 [Acidobacteria bacterium]|nr:hypothetical protein [Acidobacteriota bacterium]